MYNLKQQFLEKSKTLKEKNGKFNALVVAVRLPTGNVELITNSGDGVESKIDYYKNAYDDNFILKANAQISIIDFMLI